MGVTVAATDDVTVRATWFDNRIDNPVSNVTIMVVGANVTQQRQNLGATRVWGVQTDVEYQVGTVFRVGGGYLYDQATVEENPANPVLVGKFLPQVPEHRGSLQVSYTDPRYVNVAFGVQFIGRQFDDDLNVRTVPGQSRPWPAWLRDGRLPCVARHRAELRPVRRRAEPVRRPLLRGHAADDHRHAAPGARRLPRDVWEVVRRVRQDPLCLSPSSEPRAVCPEPEAPGAESLKPEAPLGLDGPQPADLFADPERSREDRPDRNEPEQLMARDRRQAGRRDAAAVGAVGCPAELARRDPRRQIGGNRSSSFCAKTHSSGDCGGLA